MSDLDFQEWRAAAREKAQGFLKLGGVGHLPNQGFRVREIRILEGEYPRAIVTFRRPSGIPDDVWEDMNQPESKGGLGSSSLERFIKAPSDREA